MMTTTSSSDTASLFTKFRFTNNGNGSSSGSSSGNKPPPLPPKDPVYLQQRYNAANRSAADIFSPDSPMSPTPPSREGVGQYGRHNTSSPTFNNQNPNSPFQMGAALESASMRNRSTTSLASQIPGQQLQPPLPGQQQPPTPGPSNINTGSSGNRNQSGSKKALTAFLKFPKKSPRSPNGPNGNGGDDEIPPPPQEDEGISMPWNFQHNIHVNETYDGLPPSWSTSLASAGFSEGEIGAIQARRIAGARSPPDLRYLYNERPLTPAAATAFNTPWGAAAVFTPPGSTASGSSSSQPPAQFATTPNGVPILTNPTPRSTSLRRGAATNPNTPGLSTSAPSGSFSDQQSRPPVPTIPHQLSNSSSNPSIRSAAGSAAGLRKPPPPTRRPPSPTEPGLNRSNGYAGYGGGNGYGHKPNQPSGSTFTSSDEDMSSHDHTNHTFANMNDSVAYRINPEDEPVPPVPSMHRPAMPGTRSRTNSNASQSRNGLGHGHSHSNPLVQYGHGHGHGPGHSASHSIAHSLSTSQMSHSGARSHEDTQLALHPLRIGSESELSVASGSTGGSGGHKGGAMTMGMVLMTKTMMGSKDSDAGTVLGVPVSVSGSVSTLEGYGNGLAGGGRKWKVVNDVGRRSEETAEDSGVGLGVGSNEGGESSAKSIEVVKEKEKTISKKPSLWGGKIPKTKSKAKLKPGAGEGAEDWVMPAVPGTQISPSSTNLLPGPSSSSSHGNHSVSGHASGSGTAFSSFKSSTSQLAASTSSSLAAAGSTLAGKSQLLVGAVWSGAGRVGGKLRGSIKDKSGRDKGKDKGDADDKGAEKGKDKAQGFFSPGSDEEFISMMPDMEDDVDKVPVAPVWQLYMRSAQELVDSQGQIKNDSQRLGVNGSGNHSSTSLVSKTSQGNLRGADPYGKLVNNKAATSSISLHSERSTTQKLNAHPSSSQNSLHSLKPPSKGHKANASISSLNSIPEVASPTSPPEDTTISSSTHTANDSQTPESSPEKPRPPPTKRTAALPPRLSLHKSATSSDLTSWSQALLSGISLSGSGDDDFGSGLGLGLGFGMAKDKIKEGKGKSDKLDLSFSRDFLSLGARREAPEEYDDGDDDDDDDDERDEEEERQPQSAPASAATTAKPHNFAYHQQQASVSSVSSGSGPLKPPTTTSATAPTTPVQGRSRRSGAAHLPASKPAPPMALPPPPLPLGTKTSKLNGSQQVPHLRTDSLSKGKEGEDVKQHLPFSPLNLTKNSSGMGSLAGAMNGSQSQTQTQAVSNYVDPSSLLSPPPTAWTTHSPTAVGVNVISPSVHSSTGPDSAQLWNEIERMVSDVDLSTLPPGAQGVLRSAGVVGGFGIPSPTPGLGRGNVPPRLPLVGRSRSAGSVSTGTAGDYNSVTSSAGEVMILQNGNGGQGPRTVGELVGDSPVSEEHERFSKPAYSETFSPTLPITPEAARMAAANGRMEVARGGKQGHQKSRSVFEEQQKSHSRKQSRTGLQVPQRGDRDGATMDEDDDSGSDYGDVQNPSQDDDTDDYGPPPPPPPKPIVIKPFPTLNNNAHGRQPSDHLSVSGERFDDGEYRNSQRDSSRSSSSTLTMTGMPPVTIVRKVSVARRTSAYFTQVSGSTTAPANKPLEAKHAPGHPPSSPLSSYFGSSEDSGSSSSQSIGPPMATPITADGTDTLSSSLDYYLDGTQTPSATPDQLAFSRSPPPQLPPKIHNVNGDLYDEQEQEGYSAFPSEEEIEALRASGRPTIVISDEALNSTPGLLPAATPAETPLSPFQKYRGWLSAVVAPLEEFIDEAVDPRDHYLDLREIAEGESGSVYAATLNPDTAHKLRLPPLVKAKDNDDIVNRRITLVAIKSVAIVPAGSPKLVDLQRELSLMKGLGHENVLGMDGVYVDLVEDSLWVRMELMERSLADIVGLIGGGFMLQDRMIARFASDVLHALVFLQEHNIVHRDVRSDNLLLNKHGVLKLADFSNAVQVTKENPNRAENVGVVFWQAPEVRRPPYNALKVDVWSLGATVWEMAQTQPPFYDTGVLADHWPPVDQPSLYSPAFHDFLRKTSEPASSRPRPMDLMKHSFINNACGRLVIVQLLSQCLNIESQQSEEES